MYPLIHLGPFSFYTFGLVFGLALCMGWIAFDQYFKRHDIPVNMPVLGTCLVVSGFIGAKLDDALISALLLRHSTHAVAEQILNLNGGYTYLGCLLAGSLAGLAYARIHRISVLRGFDSTFCIGLGYAVGRIGCFLAGDGDYGVPSTLPWAVSFPHGIVPTIVRVHPTMLYSSVWEFTIFAILWHLSNPRRQPALRTGTLLYSYLLASGAGRFLIEYVGRNPVLAFGLTEAQLVSVGMMACGVVILCRVTQNTLWAQPKLLRDRTSMGHAISPTLTR